MPGTLVFGPLRPRLSVPPTGLESAAQIAGRYGVSDRTVLNWLYGGIIPAALRVGKVVRFDPMDVAKALNNWSSG